MTLSRRALIHRLAGSAEWRRRITPWRRWGCWRCRPPVPGHRIAARARPARSHHRRRDRRHGARLRTTQRRLPARMVWKHGSVPVAATGRCAAATR